MDASAQIGTGHVMRCLSLANYIHSRGAYVRFVSRSLPHSLYQLIIKSGHGVSLLPEAQAATCGELQHSHWLQASSGEDAEQTCKVLGGGLWDWLIVDHYGIDIEWERIVREKAKRIFVIDDICDRKHDCDILLDQNLASESREKGYSELVPASCERLLGPKYALLRPEFADARSCCSPRECGIRRVFVSFGGVDLEDYTSAALCAIARCKPKFGVDVVVGGGHSALIRVRELCGEFGFRYHVDTQEIANLMVKADIAVGSSGTISWERCCVGLPSITVSIAENQKGNAAALERAGVAVNLQCTRSDIGDKLYKLLDVGSIGPSALLNMSRTALGLVDGMGVERVASKVLAGC